jgi:predicted RNase H-like nuclease
LPGRVIDSSGPIVVGVDGYRGGWVAIRLRNGGFVAAEVGRDLASLAPFLESAQVIGVDMPIGLPDKGLRRADVEARVFVGPRRGSVFLAMPRAVWLTEPIEAARALSIATENRSFSSQAYALRDRVLEVDAAAVSDPRIFEVHPEVSFRAIAGQSLDQPKSTWAGLHLRRALLRRVGIDVPEDLGPPGAAGPDDVLDAAAAAWSADRIARGRASVLPDPPESAADGRMSGIWY